MLIHILLFFKYQEKVFKDIEKYSKGKKNETSIIEDAFSLHTSCSNLREKDFYFGSNHSNLYDKRLIKEFDDNIKLSSYTNVDYKSQIFPGFLLVC